MCQQVNCKRLWPQVDVFRFRSATIHRAHDFLARGIAQCMCDPRMAVAAFQRQRQFAIDFVEFCAVRDEIANPLWSFANDELHNLLITQSFPGCDRISHMVGEIIERIKNSCDTTLGVRAVGLLQRERAQS